MTNIKLSAQEIPLSPPAGSSQVAALFKTALATLAADLHKWFLPHFLGGMGLFLLLSYVTAWRLFSSWAPGPKWVGAVCLIGLYGVGAFVYSLLTSCVFALRLACQSWSDLIDGILALVEERVVAQVADKNAGLSKEQAHRMLSGSVREVFCCAREQQPSTLRWVTWLALGTLALAVRWVLRARVNKWVGGTLSWAKFFAGRVTLAGAIFLNLHFLATLLLGLCYALGAAVLVWNIYFVILWK